MGANRQSTIKNQKWPGARGEIRTHHKADLKSAASSNWATRAKNFGFEISDFGFSAVVGPIKFPATRRRNPKSSWYSRRDSNPHCTDFESVVSCQLDYASIGAVGRI